MKQLVSTTVILSLTLLGATQLHAGTIIKLSMSTDNLPDVEFKLGKLSIVDDNVGATFGDQDTEVQFLEHRWLWKDRTARSKAG